MKTAIIVLAVALGLLSIAAGAAKVALVPEEAAFHHQFGFSDALTISFGAVQVLGGILLIISSTRLYGSLICASGFMLSLSLVLSTGNFAFAGVSLLPVVLSLFIAYRSFGERPVPE